MVAQGYVTHADENRRQLGWLIGLYLIALQMIGGLAAMFIIQFWDVEHTLLTNPLGYFLRYGLLLAAISTAVFFWLYRSHAGTVIQRLKIRTVTRADERRFVSIAEEQCLALGIRAPRFGVIEVLQPNALAVGEGPAHGLIAVTRGLIDQLDDDELAAVIAHEASHIRNGDTRLLAVNHAMMRTVVLLQVNNPLRIEDWRQLIILVLLPPFLLFILLSGMITMASMRMARMARQALKLSRDHIADGEAVRATHRPDALHSALMKVGGKGAFAGSSHFDDLLFDGRADAEGGSHPAVVDRLTAIAKFGSSMMHPGRPRSDTRSPPGQCATAPAARSFGRKFDPRSFVPAPPPDEEALVKPKLIANNDLFWMMLTDFAGYRKYVAQCHAWYEWRESDGRNIFGLKPEFTVPVAAITAFLLVLHWPSDGDFRKLAYTFSPSMWVDMIKPMNDGPNTFQYSSPARIN